MTSADRWTRVSSFELLRPNHLPCYQLIQVLFDTAWWFCVPMSLCFKNVINLGANVNWFGIWDITQML